MRDFLTDEVDRVVCDDEGAVTHMKELVGQISARSKGRVEHHAEHAPIFEKYSVQKQIDDAFHRQVWLKCGGYIVFDETEALIAIDVNTGRNKGSKDMDKTILQTNLEAADEIARQMRLRNVGGLIIGDFIDMKSRKDQQQVYDRMRDRLKRDKSKTHVLPLSSMGLMEMTRQRALNAIMRKHRESVHELKITVHPEVLQRLRTEDEELLVEMERRYEGRLIFRSDGAFHHEKFHVCDAVTGTELKA